MTRALFPCQPSNSVNHEAGQRRKEPEEAAGATIDAALLQHFRQDDRRFTLLHRLLSHPSSNGTDRILEALAQHAFPSQPFQEVVVYGV